MKADNIISALGDIGDKYIKEAEHVSKRQNRKGFIAVGSALTAAAAVILMITSPWSRSEVIAPYAVAYAEYPEYVRDPYADGEEHDKETYKLYNEYNTARKEALSGESRERLGEFCANVSWGLLSGEGNRAYSPFNVYAALGMLSELTEGETCKQILELTRTDSREQLAEDIGGLLKSNCRDEGLTTSLPANSLWLNYGVEFNTDVLDSLAKKYFAFSFCGIMGDEEYDEMYRGWINDMTGNLLTEQMSEHYLPPERYMMLVSTLYFKTPWAEKFSADATAPGIFHAADGDISCDFLNGESLYPGNYYKGKNFTVFAKDFLSGGEMRFFLPDAGISVNDLLRDSELRETLSAADLPDEELYYVKVSIPKFDMASTLDLTGALKTLGMTDAFDVKTADFSPLTKENVAVSSATQEIRVMIDEDGVAASSVVELPIDPIEDKTAEFVLDRPFIYEIVSDTGCPLFVGVIENPLG